MTESKRAARRTWLVKAVAHCSAAALTCAALGSSPAAAAAQPRLGAPSVVLVVGDSLSAEYGLPRGSGWVALLQQRLDGLPRKAAVKVVNASVSGDTTSGGRSRLPALLAQHKPRLVVIELGGNDALRGLPLAMTEANLVAMTRDAKAAGAGVLLVGMQVPPNYGRRYSEDFQALFARAAKAEKTALVPFLLKGVADDPARAESMFQADRIHPNAQAHPLMLDNVWAVLKPLLD